jgi:alpha-1,6-mannosyltransferase
MSTDATTLQLRSRGVRAALVDERLEALRRASRRPAVQANVALGTIVVCCVLIVLAAAGRPTFLSATTRPLYFPSWMSGPLGGLTPGLAQLASLKEIFTGVIVLTYLCYVIALRRAEHLRVRTVVGCILALHAIFLLAPPLALTDVFNYLNYARMEVVHHLNPYTTIPRLEPHTDPAFALSNWHGLLSPYGPLFTIMTFLLAPLSLGAFFWSFKLILLVTDLAILLLVWKSAVLLRRQPLLASASASAEGGRRTFPARVDPLAALVLVGLNPIVLVWGLGGDHTDFFTIFFVVLGFYLLLRARAASLPGAPALSGLVRARRFRLPPGLALDAGAGAAFVLAAGLKASAGVVVPIVLVSLLKTPRRLTAMLVGAGLAGLVTAAATISAFGVHFPDLTLQTSLVTDLSIPNLLGLVLGQGGETGVLHGVLTVALVGAIVAACVWTYRTREALTASGWAMLAALAATSWVLPWYVIWVLPLAALAGSRRLRIAALVIGAYLIVAWSPATAEVLNALNLHPGKSTVGRAHAREVRSLLF